MLCRFPCGNGRYVRFYKQCLKLVCLKHTCIPSSGGGAIGPLSPRSGAVVAAAALPRFIPDPQARVAAEAVAESIQRVAGPSVAPTLMTSVHRSAFRCKTCSRPRSCQRQRLAMHGHAPHNTILVAPLGRTSPRRTARATNPFWAHAWSGRMRGWCARGTAHAARVCFLAAGRWATPQDTETEQEHTDPNMD